MEVTITLTPEQVGHAFVGLGIMAYLAFGATLAGALNGAVDGRFGKYPVKVWDASDYVFATGVTLGWPAVCLGMLGYGTYLLTNQALRPFYSLGSGIARVISSPFRASSSPHRDQIV